MNLEDQLKKMIADFNARARTDPKLKDAIEGKTRTVVLEVTDGTSYNFVLDKNVLTGPNKGDVPNADIRISADQATLTGIFSKEINPLKAYATKKLKLKASFSDLMLLQKLLK